MTLVGVLLRSEYVLRSVSSTLVGEFSVISSHILPYPRVPIVCVRKLRNFFMRDVAQQYPHATFSSGYFAPWPCAGNRNTMFELAQDDLKYGLTTNTSFPIKLNTTQQVLPMLPSQSRMWLTGKH